MSFLSQLKEQDFNFVIDVLLNKTVFSGSISAKTKIMIKVCLRY